MNNVTLWPELVQLAHKASRRFKLGVLRVEPFLLDERVKIDADCNVTDCIIRIRLHRIGRRHQPLARSTIFASLAHELAHLRVPEHSREHGDLTRRIAAWFREMGQPVSHVVHSGSNAKAKRKRRTSYKRAWLDPRPRT
jgi:hypothetical protein